MSLIKDKALSGIVILIKLIVTKSVYEKALQLVQLQFSSTISGPEKKALVLAQLKALEGELSLTVKATASWIISLAIDIAVAQLNRQRGLLISKL